MRHRCSHILSDPSWLQCVCQNKEKITGLVGGEAGLVDVAV